MYLAYSTEFGRDLLLGYRALITAGRELDSFKIDEVENGGNGDSGARLC